MDSNRRCWGWYCIVSGVIGDAMPGEAAYRKLWLAWDRSGLIGYAPL